MKTFRMEKDAICYLKDHMTLRKNIVPIYILGGILMCKKFTKIREKIFIERFTKENMMSEKYWIRGI